MPIYFYLHERRWFQDEFVRGMAECRRLRSFRPCLALCRSMAAAAQDYWRRFHIGDDVPLVCQVDAGSRYEPNIWELLVGELIVVGAQQIPEIALAPEMLCRLAAGGPVEIDPLERESFAPMQQAHLGTRALRLGPAHYRPRHVGWNDSDAVARLAAYLAAVSPETWAGETLIQCGVEPDEAADERDYAITCLTDLRNVYDGAAAAGLIIVAELIA
jgi:hypothetical protein